MQDCFRQHPDVYGAELAEDDAAEEAAEQHAEDHATKTAITPDADAVPAIAEPDRQALRESKPAPPSPQTNAEAPVKKTSTTPAPENDPFPTKWDDATAANDAVEVDTHKEKQDKSEKKEKA
jgi:intermembrane space import and assembly protein 40